MVHVEDLADMIIILGEANSGDVEGKAYSGSSGFMITGNIYENIVSQVTGKEAEIVHFDIKLLGELKWPQAKLLYVYISDGVFGISSQKFERQFSYSLRYTYLSGLQSSLNWWNENKGEEPDWVLEDLLILLVKEINLEIPNQDKIVILKSQIMELFEKEAEK